MRPRRDEQRQCREDEGAAQIGHRHDAPTFEAVGDCARGQRQHQPRKRVGRGDARHGERARVDDQGEKRDGSVAEAVAEARYDEGLPRGSRTAVPAADAAPGRAPITPVRPARRSLVHHCSPSVSHVDFPRRDLDRGSAVAHPSALIPAARREERQAENLNC